MIKKICETFINSFFFTYFKEIGNYLSKKVLIMKLIIFKLGVLYDLENKCALNMYTSNNNFIFQVFTKEGTQVTRFSMIHI